MSKHRGWEKPSLIMAGIFLPILLASCANTGVISQAINAYSVAASRVELGQSKQKVLAVLEPTQAELSAKQKKPSETFMEGEIRKEIYFFRSRSFADGLVTDDEFTPYVFENGKLIGIGWTVIGGPKTQAQSRDNDSDIHFHGRVFYY